jgi:pyruvate/2-oxoglutarate dehydrogenase complex dihydrolipoamide dehydrogenase (E3) component
MTENDRAQAERRTDGFAKLVVAPGGRVLGAGFLAPHAGEMIGAWTLAIAHRMKLSALAGMIVPYPTLAEAGKRAAGSFYTPRLFSPGTKRLIRLLSRLP